MGDGEQNNSLKLDYYIKLVENIEMIMRVDI